jgi:hypothetical protein
MSNRSLAESITNSLLNNKLVKSKKVHIKQLKGHSVNLNLNIDDNLQNTLESHLDLVDPSGAHYDPSGDFIDASNNVLS